MLPRRASASVSRLRSRDGGSPVLAASHLSQRRRYASAWIHAARYPATSPMRVCGPRVEYTRIGFSPQAIFRPYLAPGNFIPCTLGLGTILRITLRPPNRLPDPGSTWIVVTPPARSRGNCGSCGHTECSTHTYPVTGFTSSLASSRDQTLGAAFAPKCEWSSMMPGVTYFPVPSMTTAPAGAATVAPTETTLPSCMRIAPFRVRGPAAVKMFTLRITVGGDEYGLYVLGKGSAFGTLSAPGPGPVCAATGSAANSSVENSARVRMPSCSSVDGRRCRVDSGRSYPSRTRGASRSATKRAAAVRDVVRAEGVDLQRREAQHHRRVVHGPRHRAPAARVNGRYQRAVDQLGGLPEVAGVDARHRVRGNDVVARFQHAPGECRREPARFGDMAMIE